MAMFYTEIYVCVVVASFIAVAMPTTVAPVDGRTLCYSCADTKDNGKCQSNIQEMADAAGKFLNRDTGFDGELNDYVKDCTNYENQSFCIIEVIESRGLIPSYMRDCNDGHTFAYDLSKFNRVNPDNQTTCAYFTQGYVTCVKVCLGHFCNGPKPSSVANSDKSSHVFVISILIQLYVLPLR